MQLNNYQPQLKSLAYELFCRMALNINIVNNTSKLSGMSSKPLANAFCLASSTPLL
ncbi:hypothetical protein CUMW_178310 [Citrus unshiu]|uniref:Uncharacterized protein n=1 Tax=Citrus unshiu TaxID=55188 RepID=A0A2H5PY82_CITUN|nr:hypothetical protein CUMW_178310 [Citrus unshiu]